MAMVAAEGQKKGEKVDFATSALYMVCLCCAGGVVHLISEYEFSCVLTLSALFQAMAFAMVLMDIERTQMVTCVSGKSMALAAVAILFRLPSTMAFEGYLPLDRTGDFTYQFLDIVSLALVLKILHGCYCSYRSSLAADQDTANVQDIVKLCVALAIVVHPGLNGWVTYDIAWAASLYVDAMAMLPQVMMISKTQSTPGYTPHYLIATFASRVLSSWFWMHGATNLMDMGEQSSVAVAVVAAHAVQFVLLANFAYNYAKSCAKISN